jgi:CDP-diacylglycerol--glycerol-3-phosphate 3-phosphatidyltransferase
MMRMGVAMGARSGGKVKAVAYMLTGAGALVAASLVRLGVSGQAYSTARLVAVALFAVSVLLSLSSFMDYYRVFKSARSGSGK